MPTNALNWKRRTLVLLVIICLALPLLAGSLYSVSAIHHSCVGHHCPICERIQALQAISLQLGRWLLLVCALLGMAHIQHCALRFRPRFSASASPLRLFMRMNN